MSKGNTLLDVALEALDGDVHQRLLLLCDAGQRVGGLLGTSRLYRMISTASQRYHRVGMSAYS